MRYITEMRHILSGFIVLNLLMMSCMKDANGVKTDARLDRPYCNDPQAVNYNWDFPGKPDNSICFFPTDVFRGTYTFYDSLYDVDFQRRDSSYYDIHLYAIDKSKFVLTGLCNKGITTENDTVIFTADRFYKATADSTNTNDSVKLKGQVMKCKLSDTLSGFIMKDKTDSGILRFNLTIFTPKGVMYHIGTAKKK